MHKARVGQVYPIDMNRKNTFFDGLAKATFLLAFSVQFVTRRNNPGEDNNEDIHSGRHRPDRAVTRLG